MRINGGFGAVLRTKTSATPLVSPATRFEDNERDTTYCPLPEIFTLEEAPLPEAPLGVTETSLFSPMAISYIYAFPLAVPEKAIYLPSAEMKPGAFVWPGIPQSIYVVVFSTVSRTKRF